MSKKLFALEDADVIDTAPELETIPEVGEVADATVEAESDVTEIADATAAVDEGTQAADQLEEVQEVVETSIGETADGEVIPDSENTEGLSPVAAEAVRIAVEAICGRVGANAKKVYALYATENFQSASSRKANSKIALEGVAEFLKDLWKKIKASLESVWVKVKEFWNKHVSSLGRAQKAIESMKAKVGASTGKIKDKAYIEEAPSFLIEAFPGKQDITAVSIGKYIEGHLKVTDTASDIANAIKFYNESATKEAGLLMSNGGVVNNFAKRVSSERSMLIARFKSLETDTAVQDLVGGTFYEVEVDDDEETGEVTLNITKLKNDEFETKLGVSISEKNAVKGLLDGNLKVIKNLVAARDKADKLDESMRKLFMAFDGRLTKANPKTDASHKQVKEIRTLIKSLYKYNAKFPVVQAEQVTMGLRLTKAVLGYAGLCIKNYK